MRRAELISIVGSGWNGVTHRLRRRRRRRFPWHSPYHFVAFFIAALSAHATSVVAPSFSELVAEADVIARGSVTNVTSQWVDAPQGRVIKTFVTFAVQNVLKGNPGSTLTLEFLGGTVGTDSLTVAGMPQFTVGKTEIVFVHGNGVQFCPLVRFMHGRYRVRTDPSSQRQFVARNDRIPVTSPADVQLSDGASIANASRTPASAMAPEDFEAAVSTELARQHR